MTELNTNNISTIVVLIYALISPILAAYGVEIDQGTFTSAIIGIIGLILAIWSARNPNKSKYFGNAPTQNTNSDVNDSA